MTLEVLQSRRQVRQGRRILRRRLLSFATPAWKEWLLRHGLLSGLRIGDDLKSWDVLNTAEFIERHVAKDAAVLDIGAYASEIPLVLCRMGYQRVSALDLNPDLAKMPQADRIDYRIGDFLRAPYADGSFAAITSISVIEHGFDGEALATEMARLLKPGGFFIASFDYWPEKISTAGQDIFGMSWTIFSRPEIERFVATAGNRGLKPYGPMNFAAGDKPVSCFGRDYTFAWMALQKQPSGER
jgi:SAM-dependent methyltransferase